MMVSLTTDEQGAPMALMVSTLAGAFALMADLLASGKDCDASIKGGVSLSVSVVDDLDGNPRDADCYSADDIARFDAGEWKYTGIKLTVSVGAIEADSSIWNVEHGVTNQHIEMAYLRDEILPNLYADLRNAVTSAAENLPDLPVSA
jgi:hypothetical protein